MGMDADRLARIDTRLARYVDEGRLAGWQVLVMRRGQTVHSSVHGSRDLEAGLPVEPDTLWRIYSMTKPVTAVAAMQLYEQGLVRLNNEVARYLPEFADMRVLVGGNAEQPKTVPATEPVRLWHLLTRTAGLTYAFTRSSVLDEMYSARGADQLVDWEADLAEMCRRWGSLPLLFEPGTGWNYAVATDVLGRVAEVVNGQRLDDVFAERIFAPLGMKETRWWVDADDAGRLAALYVPHPATGQAVRYDELGRHSFERPTMLSGGGGLVSTAADYARFTSMLVPWRRTRGRARARTSDAGVHDAQPPARWRLARLARARAIRGDDLRRHRVRVGLRGVGGPGRDKGDRDAGRVHVGRPREHGVLGRPGRAGDGALLHAAGAVQHVPDSDGAAAAGVRGVGGVGAGNTLFTCHPCVGDTSSGKRAVR